MRKIFFAILALFFIVASARAQNLPVITVRNSLPTDQLEKVVSLPWPAVLKAYPKIDTTRFAIVDLTAKQEVPYQLEYRGQKDVQALLLQVSVKAGQQIRLAIRAEKALPVPAKTYARYVPERKDDFAWENDKIAFRMYGKALEKTSEDAYGIDVWVKSTAKLVINDRYKKNDYHTDHGDGLDYYSVGFTLGAGGMAPYMNDKVYYSGNYRHSKVLDNGPLRSTFQLTYDDWDVAGTSVKVTKTISIDAGSQLNRIEQVYSYVSGKTLPVAIGLTLRAGEKPETLTDRNGIIGYWEPVHGNDGITGVGAVSLKLLEKFVTEPKQLLGITTVKSNVPYVYYAGAAWNKAGAIKNAKEWFQYLQQFQQELKSPLKVSIQ